MINRAAALIGSTKKIADIDEATPLASAAKAIWDGAVENVLSEHPWKPAIKRAMLNRLVTTPAFGYAYQFQLPPDCLRWLPPTLEDRDFFEGVQEGDLILTNCEGPLPVRYIWLNTQLPKWTPAMVEALVRQLAEDLAEPLSALAGVVNRAASKSDRAMRQGRRQNGLASGDRDLNQQSRSSWLAARNR
ncbi:hypothetical protein ASD39_15600 [Sphingomonas sp. Root50]|nr:hypothetical protein ASD17_12400 [Sphingomonas sp. Root1294]KQY65540.1 hypothetical protein ASD39_15600 [Sphingomonas sp. Root50]KRB95160.1 hypothetical protein ASE22_04460 [Sphingomonas sp. Root720]